MWDPTKNIKGGKAAAQPIEAVINGGKAGTPAYDIAVKGGRALSDADRERYEEWLKVRREYRKLKRIHRNSSINTKTSSFQIDFELLSYEKIQTPSIALQKYFKKIAKEKFREY